jgi:hypothetical protein
MRQVWIEKANASKPLMRRRNDSGGIETGVLLKSRDESGGCLFLGLAVSGVQVARARSWLWHGTWELHTLVGGGVGGGLSRSSDEAPVMGVERRGWVARIQSRINQRVLGGVG